MSLPAWQRRTLEAIERRLVAGEPRLASMFRVFTQLTRDEVLPRRETIKPSPPLTALVAYIRRGRRPVPRPAGRRGTGRAVRRTAGAGRAARLRMALMPLVLVALVSGAILLGLELPAANRCSSDGGRFLATVSYLQVKECGPRPSPASMRQGP